ncbi:hypothetical protein [Bacillus sp. B15-48]|uniref:hypothetical protein n=1 Tax=Bacillus sp. B15-48 TaxID=1548601 RepID=UPI00193F7429|nr:hypothetical protein [Bacillus sp. B15-48]MBM4765265.1 hypothetical protein [Bacillus sp. B15-48]
MKKIFFGIMVTLLFMSLVACTSTNEEAAKIEEQEAGGIEVDNDDNGLEEDAEGIGHHDELPYEWAGSYELAGGIYTLKFNQNELGDESMLIAFILENSNITDLEHHAAHMMEEDAPNLNSILVGEEFEAHHEYTYLLALNTEGESTFTFTISQAGRYRIFTEHHPDEFGMQILTEEDSEIAVNDSVEYEGHDHDHSH